MVLQALQDLNNRSELDEYQQALLLEVLTHPLSSKHVSAPDYRRRLLKEACRAAEADDSEVCEELANLLAEALTDTQQATTWQQRAYVYSCQSHACTEQLLQYDHVHRLSGHPCRNQYRAHSCLELGCGTGLVTMASVLMICGQHIARECNWHSSIGRSHALCGPISFSELICCIIQAASLIWFGC
ncbi:hypothetical protein WJX73_005788 [Symbiochloris irregularis]|uniref:FAM86 N-terminal domain-containing protein n=1 Tax=Symbiochloris irregularis TaxID=706552 RepID=A0AAW1NWG4_9CHLO